MKTIRPVHLNLFKMKFPPMAIVSILHRLSGVILFLLLPLALYLLHHSLQSEASFAELQTVITTPVLRFLLWVMLSAAGLHLLAGIRHMIMDCGWGEQLRTARFTAYFILILTGFVMIAAGVWLW